MQTDIHFYGTYTIARLAGFEAEDARVIATAAQFVDDSTDKNSEKNDDGEMLFSIATAHHPVDAAVKSFTLPEEHRLVWIPFHFYPGGQGNTFEEQLLCIKNGPLVNKMFDSHLALKDKPFYLHLLGIAAHVYLDTFSHYGFSGICSDLNRIHNDSIELHVQDNSIHKDIIDKANYFFRKYKSEIGEWGSKGLGHGAVATYPDRPYLSWNFKYEKGRYGNGVESGMRNNQKTYLEGLKALHKKLSRAARNKYSNPGIQRFPDGEINMILAVEGHGAKRIESWKQFLKNHFEEHIVEYSHKDWGNQKDDFDKTVSPDHISDCYRFHQAATHHRWYTLKDLMPEHGIYAV
jgi:hypothetical protein